MPAPVSSPSASPGRRRPLWTIISWVALVGGAIITIAAYRIAVENREPGDWLPGILEFLIGSAATGIAAFTSGLIALLRRERYRWWALVPFLAGLAAIVTFSWNYIRNTFGL